MRVVKRPGTRLRVRAYGVLYLSVLIRLAALGIQALNVKTVCILQPAYDPGEFAEGENEEEEITGWGPGQEQGHTSNSQEESRQELSAVSQRGEAIREHATLGARGVDGTARNSGGSLKDPSKPPGPNPSWGYWEWDSESGQWEIEDYRKRRKRQVASSGNVLTGKLQCGIGNVIHVISLTVGFSMDNQCRANRANCQATSRLGRQISHCEGTLGNCDVTVLQHYLQQCGRRTNYAKIDYECIAVVQIQNICQSKTFDSTGSLVIASPSFSGASVMAHAKYLSCECQISLGSSQQVSIPWVRTQMDVTENVCNDDMLLLDVWDPTKNRFILKEELCGVTSRQGLAYNNSDVKLTYIPNSTNRSGGFLLMVEGKPDSNAKLRVVCSNVGSEDEPTAGAGGPPPPPPRLHISSSGTWTTDGGIRLPPSFDLKKHPGFLNKTLTAWQEHISRMGDSAGHVGQNASLGTSGNTGAVVGPAGPEEFTVTSTSGTLSAVVASLSSIVVIMGSIGIYLWYKRSQRRKQKKDSFIHGRTSSSIRSNDIFCASDAVYIDPVGPESTIPTAISAVIYKKAPTPQNTFGINSKDPVQSCDTRPSQSPFSFSLADKTTANSTADNPPPALPVRPPRRKKDHCWRLRGEEEAFYDNSGCHDGAVVQDAEYTCISDVNESMVTESNG